MGTVSSTECNSYCISYGSNTPVTIGKGDYFCSPPPAPYPLTIKIEILDTLSFKITIFQLIEQTFICKFVKDGNKLILVLTSDLKGIIVTNASDHNPKINIQLTEGDEPNYDLYRPGDNYLLTLSNLNCGYVSGVNRAQCYFTRIPRGGINTTLSSGSTQRVSNTADIPEININAQTTLDGSDIGDAVFTIYDQFTYYNTDKIPDNICPPEQTSDIKTTVFRECCVNMGSVVKGHGVTLWDKLNYLFNEGDIKEPNVYVFYQNMALYGMSKYILSRLLYSKFNINYLLGKYNDRFLKKLSTSRFCKFIGYFEANDYNKYFLYSR